MNTLMFVSAAALVYPVASNDTRLLDEATYVSEAASQVIAGDGAPKVHCLDIPKRMASHERVCLTGPEWQRVFDKALRNQSIARRETAIALAALYSGSNY